jgi:hypothetical protein
VTVCTNHLALCHLVKGALPISVPQALADAEALVPKMAELEDHKVGLAAVDAGMIA